MSQSAKANQGKRPSKSSTGESPRVAVLVDTSTSWGRRIHRGIHSYDRKHGPWQLFVEARGMEEDLRVPSGWKCDGVIARVGNLEMAQKLHALQIPVVNVSGIQLPEAEFPRVISDMRLSAKMAAEHFLDRGFQHFAYFSLAGVAYVASHQEAFAKAVGPHGDFAFYAAETMRGAEPDWNLDLKKLGQWLRQLPKPVALLTWNPSGAREVIYAAQAANVMVPEEVAVLSGSDDDLLCELLQVPISGMELAAEEMGRRAAQLLHNLIRRRPVPKRTILISPLGIITRQSTDTLAIHDANLVKALNFIRRSPAQLVHVRDVARQAGVSRRVLERRFLQTLGRGPAEEIRRVRLERAKQLLVDTNMPIPEVADAAGFGSPEYLAHVFRRSCRQTPLKYRQAMRKLT